MLNTGLMPVPSSTTVMALSATCFKVNAVTGVDPLLNLKLPLVELLTVTLIAVFSLSGSVIPSMACVTNSGVPWVMVKLGDAMLGKSLTRLNNSSLLTLAVVLLSSKLIALTANEGAVSEPLCTKRICPCCNSLSKKLCMAAPDALTFSNRPPVILLSESSILVACVSGSLSGIWLALSSKLPPSEIAKEGVCNTVGSCVLVKFTVTGTSTALAMLLRSVSVTFKRMPGADSLPSCTNLTLPLATSSSVNEFVKLLLSVKLPLVCEVAVMVRLTSVVSGSVMPSMSRVKVSDWPSVIAKVGLMTGASSTGVNLTTPATVADEAVPEMAVMLNVGAVSDPSCRNRTLPALASAKLKLVMAVLVLSLDK